MGYYDKIKKDFSFRNIKLKGISCYEGDGTAIRVTVTTTANSPNIIPTTPVIKNIGKNTTTVVRVEAEIDKNISFVPNIAASIGLLPLSNLR